MEKIKVRIKLSGPDGNVFVIINKVAAALKEAGLVNESKEFISKAFSSKSYGEVLELVTEYAEVS